MDINWTEQLVDQLDWHWQKQLRPRLDGLTDAEYVWQPVENAWNLRPRGQSTTAMAGGGGDLVLDFEFPEPSPAPVTTIAWRLGHIIVGVFGARIAGHFGGPPVDYNSWVYAATADEALDQLDTSYAAWADGVRGLDDTRLAEPCGPVEGPFATYQMAALVLHINREAIHHGAEISLLRDLYANQPTAT